MEALDCIDPDQYEFVGFVDDDQNKKSADFEIYSRVILNQYPELHFLAVPGSPTTYQDRKKNIESLKINESRYITAIHRSASVGRNVKIGYNCLIMAGVVLTSNASISNHVCVLPNTVIHHDVNVDEYTLIGSNVVVAGGTYVGKNCYVGSGSNIINGISVADRSLIGLGSNIIKSIATNARVVGNPGRELHFKP